MSDVFINPSSATRTAHSHHACGVSTACQASFAAAPEEQTD
jgi:hypothetical protein